MRTALLLTALPVLVASCSGSKGRDDDKLAASRERVVKVFEEATGQGFTLHSIRPEIREFADLPRMERMDPVQTDLQAKRYGAFTIFVYEDRQARDRYSAGGRPDVHGIYWERITVERGADAGKTYWAAEKRYGENVHLTWSSKSGRRETSAQWDRLDALLRKSFGEG